MTSLSDVDANRDPEITRRDASSSTENGCPERRNGWSDCAKRLNSASPMELLCAALAVPGHIKRCAEIAVIEDTLN
jgi:hypothetical protein